MRLRAEMIIRDTALAWACEDGGVPDTKAIRRWPRRATFVGRVRALLARLMPPCATLPVVPSATSVASAATSIPLTPSAGLHPDDPEGLEASLVAADLVICQTGCLSHGAYWRVQDHCKRTGKTCVLVEQPDMLRIVRIHTAPGGEGEVRIAVIRGGTGTTAA